MATCPHCQSELTNGQCRSCGHIMLSVPEPSIPIEISPRQPVNVFVAGHAGRRLEPAGWFTRAFWTTSGILVAIFLFLVAVPLVFLMVLGIGVALTRRDAAEQSAVNSRTVLPTEPVLVIRAKREAGPQLRRMGLGAMQSGAVAYEENGVVILRGKAKDDAGDVRIVTFEWEVAGDKWELAEYSLDGQSYRKKQE